MNTRSLSSIVGLSEGHEESKPVVGASLSQKSSTRDPMRLEVLAFKALPAKSSEASEGNGSAGRSERQVITDVCDAILQAVSKENKNAEGSLIREESIVSLEEAQKSTGLLEQWGHSLKRLVWG